MKLDRNKTLWALTEGQRGRYAAAIAALGAGSLFLLAVPLVSKLTLDRIADEGTVSVRFLAAAAAALIALTAVAGAFQYLRGRWAAMASEAIVRRLRDRLFHHLERLPVAFHAKADTGDLVQRCTSDVETVRVFLAQQVVEIGRAALLLAAALPLLIALDARMALVCVALFPLIVVFAILFFRRIRNVFRAMDEAEGRMTAVLQENLTGIRVVRAFARQEHERAKFGAKNRGFRDGTQKLINLLSTYWALSDALCLGQLGLVLIVGARLAAADEISVGTLFACMLIESIVIWPLRHFGRVLADAGKATVALERLREILDEPEESAGGARPAERLSGEIVVENLSFAHAGETEDVLSDVSFRVRPGETLALLGPPGSGKSTLVQILLRLIDYERGSVRLDGHELKGLDRRFVRSQVAVVLQEPFLYSKSIGANVRVGGEAADDDAVIRSTAAASVHEAILDFEDGYDTLVGERGVTLSGGQRQRVALARALLKNAPILVLDDALSAVDTRTEASILEALRARSAGATQILIAHRLSSVAHADRILVLEGGRVVQSGTHRELVRAEGPYRRLWRIQGALEDELEEELASLQGATP